MYSGIIVGWEQDVYRVAEEDAGVTVCATIIGSTEIYPRVSFMTTSSVNDSG